MKRGVSVSLVQMKVPSLTHIISGPRGHRPTLRLVQLMGTKFFFFLLSRYRDASSSHMSRTFGDRVSAQVMEGK